MSRSFLQKAPSTVAITRGDAEIMRPEDIARLQGTVSADRMVVVQQAPKPWGWIVLAITVGLFMLLSFVAWFVQLMLDQSERQMQRAHELAMKSVNAVESQSLDPVSFLIVVGAVFGVYLILKLK